MTVGGQALAHGVARRLALELLGQFSLSFLPLLGFLHGDGQPLVLIVAAIARLSGLICLRLLHDLVNVHVCCAVLAAEVVLVGLRQDREAVGHLHIAVAPQCSQKCRVGSVQVAVVDRPPEGAQSAAFALHRQAHLLRQTFASVAPCTGRGKPALHLVGSLGSLQCAKGKRGPSGSVNRGRCTWCCLCCCKASTSSS